MYVQYVRVSETESSFNYTGAQKLYLIFKMPRCSFN